ISQGEERCAFFLLPFLTPGSLSSTAGDETPPPDEGGGTGGPAADDGKTAGPIRSQARLAREAAARLETARQRAREEGVDYAVLGAHLFTTGGLESESERYFLGNEEQVDAGLFSGFDYVALGHLHRSQRIAGNVWYSGSPLAYSFNEADHTKVFLSVELETAGPGDPGKTVKVVPIPVRPPRGLSRLRGPFGFFLRDEAKDAALLAAEGNYVEISLTDQGLVENPLALLRRRFPWLLSIKQEAAFAVIASGRALPPEPGKKRNIEDDFAGFLTEIYGTPDPGKLRLFREILREPSIAGGAVHDGS
ncbi:MAG: hypothetical protein LBP32_00260, partial [Spirochaetaceae bacterium]|nr:hypothetical protein [Spirochaetaceae bacterium]